VSRSTRAPIVSRSGHILSRTLWRLLNHRRPIAGHAVTVYRGSPVKRTGDFA
jgi:hypothetical protein